MMRAAQAATEAIASATADGAAGGDDAGDAAVIDLLDVCEAIGTHFHEHHDAIVAWSWKLFCAKWARMTVQVARQERDKRERERAREEERRWREWRDQQMAARNGEGW